MAIRKVATKVSPAKKALVRKLTHQKAKVSKSDAKKKSTITKKVRRAKDVPVKKSSAKKPLGKKASLSKRTTSKKLLDVTVVDNLSRGLDVERIAERVELKNVEGTSVSVEALKIGLLLAAVDGNCDKNEIKKFKAVAKSCGGLSDAKIAQIITQTQRRISALEEVVKQGATADDIVNRFIAEASSIGIGADCRSFVLWLSIAMVDGEFSDVERKAITALQQVANERNSLFSSDNKQDISDLFLKRCEMILHGIYKAETAGNKRLVQNRLKSLQTLIEITEA